MLVCYMSSPTWYGLSSAARSMETEQSVQYKTASLPSSATRKPNLLHALRTEAVVQTGTAHKKSYVHSTTKQSVNET